MNGRQKIKELLRKLSAITVEAGATEAEALAAAMKARKIADQHGIDLDTVGAPDITEGMVGTGRVRHRPIDRLWPAIARFCHCEMVFWTGGELRVAYVGQAHDVALAEWLHAMLKRHVDRAQAAFKKTRPYLRRKPHRRRMAAAVFVESMVVALCGKLYEATDHDTATPKLTHAKTWLEATYPDMEEGEHVPVAKSDGRLFDASMAGYVAGRSVEINTPVGGSGSAPALITHQRA